MVSTASPRAGLQASEAGGENYKYKSGNIEPGEYCKGYRASGGLGKCKSWSLSIQGWWWLLLVEMVLAHTTELVVIIASPRAGLQESGAGGKNYNYKSGNIDPSEYCKYMSW